MFILMLCDTPSKWRNNSFLPFLPQTKKKIVLSSARLLYEFLCFDPKWLFSSMCLWLIWWIWLIRRIMITSLLILFIFPECKELFRYSFSFMHFFICLLFHTKIRDWFFSPWYKASIVENEKWIFFCFMAFCEWWLV